MGKSWSATRKKLEQDLLAPSLRGRVSYQYTRYRKVHDEEPRAAVYIDGELFIDGTVFKFFSKKYMDIQSATQSENPIIRMLALMDRRLGKRTFDKIKERYFMEPDWLKNFYMLRFESEKNWGAAKLIKLARNLESK